MELITALLMSLFIYVKLNLLVMKNTLYSMFFLSVLNSMIGMSILIIKSFTFIAGLIFLVFMGGLLVLFFYLVSLKSNVPAMNVKLLMMSILMPIIELSTNKIHKTPGVTLQDHKTFLLADFSKLWGLSGLLMVLLVMLVINTMLSESSFSVRKIF